MLSLWCLGLITFAKLLAKNIGILMSKWEQDFQQAAILAHVNFAWEKKKIQNNHEDYHKNSQPEPLPSFHNMTPLDCTCK